MFCKVHYLFLFMRSFEMDQEQGTPSPDMCFLRNKHVHTGILSRQTIIPNKQNTPREPHFDDHRNSTATCLVGVVFSPPYISRSLYKYSLTPVANLLFLWYLTNIHPRKPTWTPKLSIVERNSSSKASFFHVHVSFDECTYLCKKMIYQYTV